MVFSSFAGKSRSPIRRVVTLVIAFAVGLVVADRMMVSRTVADERGSTTRPALADDVQAIIDRLDAAYAKTPIAFVGTMISDVDVAGMTEAQTIPFTATIRDPASYRHDAREHVLVVSNPTSVTLYVPSDKQYMSATRPAHAQHDKPGARTLQGQALLVLSEQNPAMLIAALRDARQVIEGDAKESSITKLAPETEDGKAYDRLECNRDGVIVRYWIEQATGLIARVETDYARMLETRGAPDVKKATMRVQYQSTTTGDPAPSDEVFVFEAPAGASELVSRPTELLTGEPNALEGKPAPAFTLKDLDGADVALDASKGQVVVLDFWATWCGPCRAGMPHLAAIAKKHQDNGVVVLAINQREDADTVRQFLAEQKIDARALLDADGEVGAAYGVNGIPHTVVIGRDGNVRKVIVGYNEKLGKEIEEAVEATIAEGK